MHEDSGQLALVEQPDPEVEKQLHRTIAKVGHDIEKLAFNTAIAALIGFVNTATSSSGLTKSQVERFARVLAPFAPHISEELWHRLGMPSSIARASWPEVDPAQLEHSSVEIPVQIMGKLRHRVVVPAGLSAAELEKSVLEEAKVRELLAGKTVKKVIVVPGKLVNIVAN